VSQNPFVIVQIRIGNVLASEVLAQLFGVTTDATIPEM
jgi:predicted nuclease of predicted toxin-antitoxin system